MQIAVQLASPRWEVEKVSAEGDGSPEKRGTRRGKRRWLRSPPSFFVQNMQQDGKESCCRQLGARCPYDLMWKEDSKDHDQSRAEPQASECERLSRSLFTQFLG